MSFRAFFGAVAGIWRPAVFLLSFIVPLFHGTARATTVPLGLSPGDTYQYVFVTQDLINALSPDRSTYDAFAQAQALLNPALTGASATFVYHAIVATVNQPNMQLNTGVGANTKVYLLNGTSLVDTGAGDFWDGNHLNVIDQNQFGVKPYYATVWSGCSSPSGLSCAADLLLGNNLAEYGVTWYWDGSTGNHEGPPGSYWISDSNITTTYQSRLYAISPMVTVPVSETPLPAAIFLYATGLGVMGLLGFRKRRHRAGAVAA